jgi:hypothetical protein
MDLVFGKKQLVPSVPIVLFVDLLARNRFTILAGTTALWIFPAAWRFVSRRWGYDD